MESTVAIDATAAALAEDVATAEEALRNLAAEEPERWWAAYELKARARNGGSAGAMSMALNRLVDDGTFELTNGDQVRLSR